MRVLNSFFPYVTTVVFSKEPFTLSLEENHLQFVKDFQQAFRRLFIP